MPEYSVSELKKHVQKFPKTELIRLPTPFYKLESLSRFLGGAQIYIKRDDLTGLAFGGKEILFHTSMTRALTF